MRKKYEKYKDSGIEWIGEIPEHWKVMKVKQIAQLYNGFAFDSEEYVDDGIPIIRIGDVSDKDIEWGNLKKVPDNDFFIQLLKRFGVKNGDVLIALTGATIGKSSLYKYNKKALLNQRVGLIRSITNNSKYIFYFVQSPTFKTIIDLMCYGGAQNNIGKKEIDNIFVSIPNHSEQNIIVNYLDQKTSEIDSLIADKEKLIQRLQEYKQSVITEAVTKGLNPDVNMKDSGVEWIGEVPEHWEVKRLKDFAQVSRGTIDKNVNENEIPVYLVPYTSIYSKREQRESDDDYLLISVTKKELNNSMVIKGDILLTASSETPDDIGRSTVIYDQLSNHVFGSDILRIRIPEQTMVLNYRKYLMENHIYLNKFNSLCRGVTRFRFGMNDFKTIRYPLPPIQEQKIIADYLDKKANDINSLAEDTRKQIDLLKEYRQSLIYEAVTGKIDVRDYKPENYKLERSESLA